MHYDINDVLSRAGLADESGWKRATVTLSSDDTTYAPGTTKKILTGAGRYVYVIHSTGMYVEEEPADSRMVPAKPSTMVPCAALLPGHRHCEHGHTADCPDPGECDIY